MTPLSPTGHFYHPPEDRVEDLEAQVERLEAERDASQMPLTARDNYLLGRAEDAERGTKARADKALVEHETFKERLLGIAQEVEERGRATLKAGAARTGLFAEAAAIREAVAIASENPETTEEGTSNG